jgi:hypothetical protein
LLGISRPFFTISGKTERETLGFLPLSAIRAKEPALSAREEYSSLL